MTTTVEEDHAADNAAAAMPAGAESADAEVSPRPLPTGKLHRNMHILNSIVRTIGKASAYMDEQETDQSHFFNPAHAPTKVLTIEDASTGLVVPASEEAVAAAPAGSAPGSKPASRSAPWLAPWLEEEQ